MHGAVRDAAAGGRAFPRCGHGPRDRTVPRRSARPADTDGFTWAGPAWCHAIRHRASGSACTKRLVAPRCHERSRQVGHRLRGAGDHRDQIDASVERVRDLVRCTWRRRAVVAAAPHRPACPTVRTMGLATAGASCCRGDGHRRARRWPPGSSTRGLHRQHDVPDRPDHARPLTDRA